MTMRPVLIENGNLYAIAAKYLGDATQWVRIAALNGLDDPMLNGMRTLLIPSQDTAAGGGIVNQ